MKRVHVIYGGVTYTLARTTADEVKATLDEGLRSGDPVWLTVNSGEGKPQPVEILVAPGIPIAVADVSTDDNEIPEVPSGEFGSAEHHAVAAEYPHGAA